MIDMSVHEALQGMVMQRVDTVDRMAMQCKEYVERQSIMNEIEKLCREHGKEESFEQLRIAVQNFEYLMASNCYVLGIKDRMQIESMELI
ncbi:MAG: hypothetical protein J6H31_07560 [Butyrivibrio sp.]|nr:hypothetical protein [Butyrivibrio sp.]